MMAMHDYKIALPKEALKDMPIVECVSEVVVIEDIDTAVKALDELNHERRVGFDTETRPTFRRGCSYNMSLIQISTLERSYLFRINKIGFIPQLRAFIENDAVMKIGLSLKDDFFVLHKLSEFAPNGFIDLQSYVRNFHIADSSLQKIYGIVFGERISKGQRLSNWEAPTLSPAQQHYAAIDAWACLRLYDYLHEGYFDPLSSPYIVPDDNYDEIGA